MAYELSKAGFDVVAIDAGPFWNPQTDFASDELSVQSLAWNDTRLVTGSDPLSMGHNNSGRGVGGGTVHFTGVFFRFHESDFKVKTLDGVADDWPITYQDLEPYYPPPLTGVLPVLTGGFATRDACLTPSSIH